jgi:hypothetical protein
VRFFTGSLGRLPGNLPQCAGHEVELDTRRDGACLPTCRGETTSGR